MTDRIAVLDDFQGVALRMADWSVLAGAPDIAVFRENIPFGDALIDRLRPFDIIVAMRERTPFPATLIAALPRLRLLVTTGMWNRAIDMEAARKRGIVVCGTESSKHAPLELAWALILGLIRRLPLEHEAMRSGMWQTGLGGELHGRTLGVLGLGRLGREAAAIGRAFGMEIIAWSPNLTAERCAEAGVLLVDKEGLFRRSDVLTLHVVLSERTRGLVGEHELSLMKPTAFLVNTSRGPIVDEAALLDCLHRGRIAGAGLDVYDREPLPANHPLRKAPRTLLTPHIGIATEENYRTYYGQAVENIRAFQCGRPIRVLN